MAEPREIIRSEALPGICHGFLTGIGHEGEPDPGIILPDANASANGKLVLVKQVHSAVALIVDAPFGPDSRPDADAIVSATPGLVLGIVTADCAPVLLADRDAGVIGAAHAGWRGAIGGVLEATIAQMVSLGASPSGIVAAIGPTIAQPSYEVDTSFRETFLRQDASHTKLFAAGKPGHWHFDLPRYVAERLRSAGITTVDDLAINTYADPARFHSFRRATHWNEPTYGRQFSLIGLPN